MPRKKSVISNNEKEQKSSTRGRPKKKKPIVKKQKVEPVEKVPEFADDNEKDEEIVLFIPLNESDINRFNDEDDETVLLPINTDNKQSNSKRNKKNGKDSMFTLSEMTCDFSDNSNDSDEGKSSYKNIKLISDLRDEVTELKKKIEYYEKTYDDSGLNDKNIYKLDIQIYDHETEKEKNIKKTKLACWWCTEKFTNLPYFLPEKIVDDTYYVIGNFCMPECAAAYNEYDLNDYKKNDRYSMLSKLYNPKGTKKINFSPRRELLKKFGGPYSIKKYRLTACNNDIICRFMLPPMKPLIPIIEEIDIGKVQLRKDLSKDGLVLKRKKPLKTNKNKFFSSIVKY